MLRVGLRTYRCVYCLPAGILLLSAGGAAAVFQRTSFDTVPKAIFAVLVLWLILGRWIAEWLVPFCVSTLSCPRCDEEVDCVNVWNCGCGYHDHRERHVLGRACPKCGQKTGYVNCPRCDATMLLW